MDTRFWRRTPLVLGLVALASAAASVVAVPRVHADTVPASGTPATVSADALPTWQLNGVVWSQVTVGNTVYATGSFTKARPPGTAVGSSQEIPAANIFAYDIRTGARVTTFSHTLNGQGRAVTASPDGTRVYVGGDFTTVDGQARGHLAAFDVATGALVTNFRPSTDAQVRSLAATNTTVYAGGSFSTAAGQPRTRLAALTTSGAATSWKPSADDGAVWAMVLSPDGTRLIVGGAFTTLNTTSAYGMGALSTSTGAVQPWAANTSIRDATSSGAITSLRTDGTKVYGSGYDYGSASNFEGSFAADPSTGRIIWLDDCLGDTYDVLPVGQVLYSVGHAHNCSAIGEFPETKTATTPRTWHRALASPTYARGRNVAKDAYGNDFTAFAASTHLPWYPTLEAGTFTGQSQAAWSVTGNADYIALGGEFPKVNASQQQDLVRFARTALAPNKRGIQTPDFALQVTAPAAGSARLQWTSQWDMDNELITYSVFRDGSTTAVGTLSATSSFWNRPALTFTDTGLAPGTHSYTVLAKDPFGNPARSPAVSVVVP